jgi:hypothetical protein
MHRYVVKGLLICSTLLSSVYAGLVPAKLKANPVGGQVKRL